MELFAKEREARDQLRQRWAAELAAELNQPAEALARDGLMCTDFPANTVRVEFEDGSQMAFRHAFHVQRVDPESGFTQVAIFTEHCGYYEVLLSPDDRIEARPTY